MNRRLLFIFCLPNVVIGLSITAMSVVIPAFYAKHTAASLAAVGTGLFIARLVDAICDPLIGYTSDLTAGHAWRRKPWLLAGALAAPLCVWFMFAPPASATGTYFAFWCVLMYLAWTTLNIPYRAWGVEISRDYVERSRIFTALGIAYGVGAIGFAVVPMLTGDSELAPRTMAFIGLLIAVLFPITTGLALWFVPGGTPVPTERPSVRGLVDAVRANRPLRWFLLAFFLGEAAQGAVLALFYLFVDLRLGLAAKFPLALLAIYITGLVSLPLWLKLVQLTASKARAWAIGWGGAAVLGLTMAAIPSGDAGLVPLLVIAGLYGACNAVEAVLPYAVLGDVVDYDTWKTRVNRAGNYNAFAILCMKAGVAVGGASAFWMLSLSGFKVAGPNAPDAEMGFVLALTVWPALLYGLSSAVLWRFPIDRRRHDTIRRRLERRVRLSERPA